MEGILAQVSAASEFYDLHPREGEKNFQFVTPVQDKH
jgi:hypothetical protein